LEPDPRLAEVYRRLSLTEGEHAGKWSVGTRERRPSWRARTLATLARRFGPDLVLGTLIAQDRSAASAYARQGASAHPMAQQERSHARVLAALAGMGGVQ